MLLSTKLAIPQKRSHLVARPRLFALLDQGLTKKLILVSASPGFGKTTLVTEWLYQHESLATPGFPKVAWLSLDESDNDPIRFLSYVIAALQKVDATIGASVQALLQTAQLPSTEVLLTLLINDISASGCSLLLVLDDYHTIHIQAIHDALIFWLEHLPLLMRLVITSRSDPPLPLARWRVRRELVEVRARDLRFLREETSDFLRQELTVGLNEADIAALEQRTEGWIAGLQLAALSMTERVDVQNFIQAFTGSHTYIVDYLGEEVLQRQPPEIQQFLLHTAILERLSGPLCDEVTGQPGAQGILERIERANLFLVPLDNARTWYRYHHMFADVLRNYLRQTHPHLVEQLHQRASRWFQQQGFTAEAIFHALAANDLALTADLIEAVAERMLKQGEHITLQSWLQKLPGATLQVRPRLALAQAAAFVIVHNLDAADSALQLAFQAVATGEPVERAALYNEAAAIRTGIALARGDYVRVVELAQQALAQLTPAQLQRRGEVTLHLGIALALHGDPIGAERALEQAAQLGSAAGDLRTALLAIVNQGARLYGRARLRAAAERYRAVLRFAEEHGVQQIPTVAFAHDSLGELHLEWNDVAKARLHVEEAIARGEQGRMPRMLVSTYTTAARLQDSQGDAAGAAQMLAKAWQLAREHNLSARHIGPVEIYQVRCWLAQGNLAAAEHWATASGLHADDADLNTANEERYLALARLLWAQGETNQANRILERLYAVALQELRFNSAVMILLLQTLVLQAQGDSATAQSKLIEALQLAEPGGYLRVFMDEGEPMRRLLDALRATRTQFLGMDARVRTYLEQVLAAFGHEKSVQPLSQFAIHTPPLPIELVNPKSSDANVRKIQNLIEPLTERELEVLQLVAQGLSDRQIAEQLIVVIGTVKRHLNNLYGKLGVHTRTQALVRARELNLL
ncbi:MAG: LuxR C-terminal-related transcriptional regulator [Caldilineaceae bacterium]